MTQTIVRNARQVILVADSGKIGRPAPLRIGRLDMIDWLVTDRLTDDRLRRACADHDVRVVEAFA